MRELAAEAVYPINESSPPEEVVTVASPREARDVSVSRLTLTLPMVGVIVGTALAVSGAQYVAQAGQREAQAIMQSDIRDMSTRMEYEAKLNEKDSILLEQRFQALEAKIENSGLRGTAMALSTELQKQHTASQGK